MTPRGRLAAAGLLADHPRHVLALTLALGLLASGLDARLLFALAALVVILLTCARSPAHVAVAGAALLLLGGGLGAARLATIDADPLAAAPRGFVQLRGYIVSPPQPGEHGVNLRLRERATGQLVAVRTNLQPAVLPQIGQEVAVRGRLTAVEPTRARTPEARAYAGYLRRQGVRRQLTASAAELTGGRRGGLWGMVDGVRMRADAALARDLPPEAAGLLRGMVLGGDAGLSESTSEHFRRVGLSHILAVSGQNVLLIVILVQAILMALGARRLLRLLLPALVIVLYVLLCGAQASVIRAGVMGLAALAALAASRRSSRIYAPILASIVLLLWNPRSVADVGAQLSFAAVLGIMAFTEPLAGRLTRIPRWIGQALAATFGATLATAPLMAHHFGAVSLISLLANVLGEPLIGPIVWLGSLTAALAQFSIPLAAMLNAVTGFLLATLLELARVLSSVPGAQVELPQFGAPALALGFFVVALAAAVSQGWIAPPPVPVRGRAARPQQMICLALALVLVGAVAFPLGGGAKLVGPAVVMVDVGQGDAMLLLGRGCAALIDTGPAQADIAKKLRALGVRRLDALLVTHEEDDHNGGVDGLRRAGMLDDAARIAPLHGARWQCPGLLIEVIAPAPLAPGAAPPDDLNTRSAVSMITLAGLRIFNSGDAESPYLQGLHPGPVDVLKVPHHGSDDAGLPALLARLAPRVALIGVGRDNRHGHPTPATLAALSAAGAVIRRTDKEGTIVLRVDE